MHSADHAFSSNTKLLIFQSQVALFSAPQALFIVFWCVFTQKQRLKQDLMLVVYL